MPRKSRIDAPGALHHIIGRGIDRNRIFQDELDRNRFMERLASLLSDTRTACYAWALIPNHFHLLLRSGVSPVAGLMRRLLTGYAVVYNHRHRRWGHLFQNRWQAMGWDVDKIAQRVATLMELPVEAVWAAGKQRKTVAARSLLCYWAVRHLGVSMSSLAQRLGISPTSVSQSVTRGEALALNNRLTLA